MKISNFEVNKKKVISLLFALGLCLCPKESLALLSYNSKEKLSNGQDVKVYFTTGDGPTDYAFVTLENQVGYIENQYIIFNSVPNYDYEEKSGTLYTKDNCNMYVEPSWNSLAIFSFTSNTPINLIAKSYDGWYAVFVNNQTGFIHENCLTNQMNSRKIAKITGNNVNIRSTPEKCKNIIGFCDKTDKFVILGNYGDWYNIDYLGQSSYISSSFVREEMINENDLNYQKAVYLTRDSNFYRDVNGNYLTTLPMYQNAFVIEESGDYLKVMIDGVVGYISKNDTKTISTNFAVVDLGRQIIKVYHGTKEVFRAHIISGRKVLQSDMGYFKIGHHLRDYPLTSDHTVAFWMQYNGDEGIHDADWQKKKYFEEVAIAAYERFTKGMAQTYPSSRGSQGCINLTYEDAMIIFGLLNVGDHVLVIAPNNLVKNNLLSKRTMKVSELLNLKWTVEKLSQEKTCFYNKIKTKKIA